MSKELLDHYNIEADTSTPLEGYASINVKVTDKNNNQFVQKIYTEENGLLLAREETRLLDEIKHQLPFEIPSAIVNNRGQLFTRSSDNTFFRLLKFIEGKFIAETPHTPELLYSLGVQMARLHIALQDKDSVVFRSRKLFWDLQYADLNMPLTAFIKNPSDKKLADYFFDQFLHFAAPEFKHLRHGLIHGDLNDWNILVKDNNVSAFIDFGDFSYTPLINELAIAMTYMMLGKDDPFTAALPVISGYHSLMPLQEKEIRLLRYLIPCRLCISVCNAAKEKATNQDTAYKLVSEAPAWQLLQKWIETSPIHITDLFLSAAQFPADGHDRAREKAAEGRGKYFGRSLGLSYDSPVMMTAAAFQYMYDETGNTYLDAYNNIPHIGHCHPAVTAAISRHTRILNTNTRYLSHSMAAYAERLLTYFPSPLNKIFFVNSGTEATDLALRMAETCTGGSGHIVMESGYHGHSSKGIEVSAYKFEGKGGRGRSSSIVELPLANMYNGLFKTTGDYLDNAMAAIDVYLEKGNNIASFIAEPISGCGGQIPLADGYLQMLYAYLKKKNIVTISDEVQTGFGRLGKWFWGFEMHGVTPDIVVLGKPMGNGHPVAAVVTTNEIAERFANGMEFFSSFGGNNVSCEVGLAVLETLEREQLQEHALATGNYFKERLTEIQKVFPQMGDVRGHGLFLGIEFIKEDKYHPHAALAAYVKNGLKKHFILTGTDGRFDNVLKIKPPLCFSKKNVASFCDALQQVLQTARVVLA